MKEVLTKKNKEYVSNGVYEFNNELYATIWRYKKERKIDDNTMKSNQNEGRAVKEYCSDFIPTKPDYGHQKTVLAYPVKELNKYYLNK